MVLDGGRRNASGGHFNIVYGFFHQRLAGLRNTNLFSNVAVFCGKFYTWRAISDADKDVFRTTTLCLAHADCVPIISNLVMDILHDYPALFYLRCIGHRVRNIHD